MKLNQQILSLLNRLARLDASQGWAGDLNPTQSAAAAYLARANRFSRSPSHVAEYLGTTRGTMSQTLKALVKKGYVIPSEDSHDKRSISYQLTDLGRNTIEPSSLMTNAIETMPLRRRESLATDLQDVLHNAIESNGNKPFGVCHQCRHYRPAASGGFCELLSLPLTAEESEQICHEQQSA